jgi:alkylhydroperoxidase/carboxymuconolactone decarboxylase family protein YurZ
MFPSAEQLPSKAGDLASGYPAVWEAYSHLGQACAEAGPIQGPAQRLIKLALAIGANSEGAVHSHARRALEEGISARELKHVALLAIPTLGLPHAVRVLSWIEDITGKQASG